MSIQNPPILDVYEKLRTATKSIDLNHRNRSTDPGMFTSVALPGYETELELTSSASCMTVAWAVLNLLDDDRLFNVHTDDRGIGHKIHFSPVNIDKTGRAHTIVLDPPRLFKSWTTTD